MQTPAFPSLQSRYKSFTNRGSNRASSNGFFETHPVGEVVRSLFFSSILWMLLAIILYAVYSLVVGSL
jgi:ABC-type sugar transport system permease subunit